MVKLNLPTVISLLAVIVVIAAILGGVYGIFGSPGNQLQQTSVCEGSKSLATRLTGLNIGHVAAFQIADSPKFVGDLKFSDETGNPAGLADYRGKTVLLNLWATWCVPCREEMPTLDALQEKMGGPGFQVLPVSVDLGDDAKPKKFYADTGIRSLPFRYDGTMAVFNDLKKMSLAIGMPVTLLVDKNGCALGSINGPADWASDDAMKMIGAVIDGN